MSAFDPKRTFHPRNFPLGVTIALKADRQSTRTGGASRRQRQARAPGPFSTENIKLFEDLVGCPPIKTKQFVEDFKAAFS
jgi:hypothetical protein